MANRRRSGPNPVGSRADRSRAAAEIAVLHAEGSADQVPVRLASTERPADTALLHSGLRLEPVAGRDDGFDVPRPDADGRAGVSRRHFVSRAGNRPRHARFCRRRGAKRSPPRAATDAAAAGRTSRRLVERLSLCRGRSLRLLRAAADRAGQRNAVWRLPLSDVERRLGADARHGAIVAGERSGDGGGRLRRCFQLLRRALFDPVVLGPLRHERRSACQAALRQHRPLAVPFGRAGSRRAGAGHSSATSDFRPASPSSSTNRVARRLPRRF